MTNAVRLPDAAVGYAERGIAVFPLMPREKKPYGRSTGLHAASTDPDVVRAWWAGQLALDLKPDAEIRRPILPRPTSNIGIAAGPVSGFWVLDLDGPEAEAAVARHEAEHGQLPRTVQQSTGRGRHLCFAWDPRFPVRNMSKKSQERIGAKIDVRGEGGYIVAPPSVHPGKPEEGIPPGRLYAWSPGCAPDQLLFAPAPDWLLQLVCPPPEPETARVAPRPRAPAAGRASAYGEAALDGATRDIIAARVGTRDTTLYRASCSIARLVAGGEIEPAYARDALIDAGGVHVPDAMTAAQLARQVDRALVWGETRPRSAPDRPQAGRTHRHVESAPAAEGVEAGSASEASALWASARSAWVRAVSAWFEAHGLDAAPVGVPEILSRFRVHHSAPWPGGRRGPALLAPLVVSDGDPVEALAVLPLHPKCQGFTALIGDAAGKVVMVTPMASEDPLVVALDLQDAWRLMSDAPRRGFRARAVVAPRLATFAGGVLGDRYGRIDPETPMADPDAPPWRMSGQDAVYLAVRRDLQPPAFRARAFGGGSRDVQLQGDDAARFFGGLARQAWSTTTTDFQGARAVQLLAPAHGDGFNSVGRA